jgi:hypothetical protein
MPWIMNGDSSTWVDDVQEPGQWVGGGGDAPAQFIPTYAPQYAGGGGDAMGTPIPLSPAFIQQQQQTQQNISPSFGGLATNAQGAAFTSNPSQSQLSTNPDPTQPFNFVANPYVTAQNPFSKPINNAIQAYLGRPATQQEMLQYTTQLAKNPDSYNTLVEGIRNSTEAANAAQSGKQNLIIDPRQGDMTGGWLNASYGKYTPTSESGLSKITNAIGSAIPLAGLGIMTGGLGSALGLGAIAGGALAGGVTGAAGAGLNGGNVGKGALTGALTGALGGGTLSSLGGASNVASGGLDLGSNFNWNLPDVNPYTNQFIDAFNNSLQNPYELGQQYAPTAAGPNIQVYNVNGQPIVTDVGGAANTPLVNSNNPSLDQFGPTNLELGYTPQAGPTYSELGYTPQAGPTYSELGYAPSSNTSPFSGFNPASTLSSLYNTLTNGTGINPGSGTNPGTGPYGTTPGSNGPGGNGPNTPNTPNVNPNIKIPGLKIPGVTTTPTLSTLLRSPTLYQSAPGGLYKGNQNPFMFGKEQPVQSARQSYDPFAALNVPQIPLTETPNLLAQALRQG